ncbi:MAG: amidohydrolase family protein [Coriobacteriia bacterium]|nr:amidohydrolase family protein [Coriobacteriia bacterium]
MLLTADWALPVSGPPVPGGAVAVRGAHIAAVGPAEELRLAFPNTKEHAFSGCVLTPGLVNAHTHLSLTALGGLLPSAPFPEWVRLLAEVLRGLGPDDLAASASLGALRCLRCGVTAVGDVAYGPEALAAAADLGLGGAFFWEVFGTTKRGLEERLAAAEYPAGDAGCGPRATCGLTPHSIYTSGPGLLRAAWRAARESDRPMMLHVAESAAEMRLAASGDGPLRPVARRLAHRFRVPRASPVSYLTRLGVLEGTVAVHCVHLAHGDAERLAANAGGVVLCPTSNEFLENGPPPVACLRAAGCRLAVGTDSAASAPEAWVIGEARLLASLDAGLSPEALLRMLTADGAETLGVGDRFGTLEEGKQADVVAFRLGPSPDPVRTLLQSASPEDVEAVMTGGVWRILERRPAFGELQLEQAAEGVRSKAAELLRRAESRPGRDGDPPVRH